MFSFLNLCSYPPISNAMYFFSSQITILQFIHSAVLLTFKTICLLKCGYKACHFSFSDLCRVSCRIVLSSKSSLFPGTTSYSAVQETKTKMYRKFCLFNPIPDGGGVDCASGLENLLEHCQFLFLWPKTQMTIFLMHFYGYLSQKKFSDFLSKNLSFTCSWHNQPPPIRNAQFWSPSGIGLRLDVM